MSVADIAAGVWLGVGASDEEMMVERRQIVEKARAGGAEVMATLLRVQGSSYRREGARLLLAGDGGYAGSISGGCLEGDLLRRAKWLTAKGSVVHHYSTNFEDTDEIPFGLGCGGELDVLLERADSAEFGALMAAMERSLAGDLQTLVHWLPDSAGRRLRRVVLGAAGEVVFRSEGLTDAEVERSRAADVGWPEAVREVLAPPQRLVVFGAGDDAKALAAMGAAVGWTVWVADGRRQLARAERFPGAEQVVVLGTDEEARGMVRAGDAVVLMTHSYPQDKGLLRVMLEVGPRYLGLLGARHRSSLLLTEVAAEMGWELERCAERLHAPVGLDLGGDGAEAVALAIVAEVQACVHGRPGAGRRLGADEVRVMAEGADARRYAEAWCALEASAGGQVHG